MKFQYRLLLKEELEELEKEFIEFLVVNGITAEDWVEIKNQKKDIADKMIGLFSDVVFEGIFRKAKYLDFLSDDELLSFQCLKEKIVLVGLECKDPGVNLTQKGTLSSFSAKLPENVKVFQTEKTYSKKREIELFEMTQKGATISNGDLFKKLNMLYAGN